MERWAWNATDKTGKHKPITVMAVTYTDAKVLACQRFGFVDRHPNGDSPQIWKVEIEVVRNAK